MSTITASLINLTNSTPQNGHLSIQPKNPVRYPLDPLAQQAKSVLIPIFKIRICTLSISYKCRHNGVYRLFFCTFQDSNRFNMRRLWELINRLDWLCNMVSLVHKSLDIPNQRRRITTNVNHLLWFHLTSCFN